MKAIIYDPQQQNMESLFCLPGKEANTGLFWHAVQSKFRARGFEMFTPQTYDGNLSDVDRVIFQNVPNCLEPKRHPIKSYFRGLFKEPSFYKKCVNAGIPKRKMAAILYEPEIVSEWNYYPRNIVKFGNVFTWDKDLIARGKPFREFVYPQETKLLEGPTMPFEDRKLICNFSANKKSVHRNELYSARVATIRFLQNECGESFDHYGHGWTNDFTCYRGIVENKKKVMSKYRFNLCYENARGFRGYVTEKIFDTFSAGCVPIYWGAEDIDGIIPEHSFIDRRKFPSDTMLLKYILAIDKNTWSDMVKAGQQFISGPASYKYGPNGIFELLYSGLFGDEVV